MYANMARGWESKSVEAQQEESRDRASETRVRLGPEAAAALREKETLRLARQRVLEQLKASPSPQHRRMLESALADLDTQLRQIDGK